MTAPDLSNLLRVSTSARRALQVLGVSAQATSKQVEAAYRQRRRAAEMKSDKEALKRIEAAHSSLFMKSLSSRLSVRYLLQFEHILRSAVTQA